MGGLPYSCTCLKIWQPDTWMVFYCESLCHKNQKTFPSREVSSLWSSWGIHKPSSPFLRLCQKFFVQGIPKSRPTNACPSDWRRVIWWLVGKDYSCWGQMQKGLNSLVILGAWTIWNHHNRCVFDGVPLVWLEPYFLLVRKFSCGFWLGLKVFFTFSPSCLRSVCVL